MGLPLYIANWKMFHSLETADAWMQWWQAHPLEGLPDDCLIALCPPAPLIYPLYAALARGHDLNLRLGAQTLHHEFKGAYTGDVSGVALWSVGAQLVLVGHSERRHLHEESDERVGQQMMQAYLCGLMPVLCIGESNEERDDGKTLDVLTRQLESGLGAITGATLGNRQCDPDLPSLAVAYEPVWAIGSGRSASASLADEVLTFIASWLDTHFGAEQVARMSLLYGGSVTPANVGSFTMLTQCDGVLVGGASLEPEGFQAIVQAGLLGQGVVVQASPLVLHAPLEGAS